MSERALDEMYSDGEVATETPQAATPAAVEVGAGAGASVGAGSGTNDTPDSALQSPAPQPDPMAPVKALLDERDRRKAAEAKAAQAQLLLNQVSEERRKAQEAAAQLPDLLADPDGYTNGIRAMLSQTVSQAQAQWQDQQDRVVETLSRNAMRRHIGNDRFSELAKFASAAPDAAHDAAYESGDPWGWMLEKFEQAEKHRKAQSAFEQLDKFGGKSIDEIVAERLAEERAKWQAEQEAVTPTRARASNGTFAPSPATQRHTPPDLAEVDGAVAAKPSERGSALSELYG